MSEKESCDLAVIEVPFPSLTAEYAKYAKAGRESLSVSVPRLSRLSRFPTSNFDLQSPICAYLRASAVKNSGWRGRRPVQPTRPP
jgi:hypothetical protein